MTLVTGTPAVGRGRPRGRRFAISLLALLLTATALAACGRKGNPDPPGEGSLYPRQYPAPERYTFTFPEEPEEPLDEPEEPLDEL
jgi:hypothetical protein